MTMSIIQNIGAALGKKQQTDGREEIPKGRRKGLLRQKGKIHSEILVQQRGTREHLLIMTEKKEKAKTEYDWKR